MVERCINENDKLRWRDVYTQAKLRVDRARSTHTHEYVYIKKHIHIKIMLYFCACVCVRANFVVESDEQLYARLSRAQFTYTNMQGVKYIHIHALFTRA